MKYIKIAVVQILFALLPFESFSQIYFKNNTEEPVFVAFCMYYDGENSKYFGSEGWFKVEPGDKKMVSSAIGFNDNIYYYAYSTTSNKKFEGDTKILVHPTDKFFIKNVNKEYKKQENDNLEWRKFRHIDMNSGTLQLKYTIELNY